VWLKGNKLWGKHEELVYIAVFFNTLAAGGLKLKSSSLHVFLNGNISDDCARELFKPLKDLKSFGINNKKKFWGFGFRFFCT